jgi:hypothetical protein
LESKTPMTFRLHRNRQTMPPSSGFQLDTGNNECPCHLLALAIGEFDGLGAQSRFRGRLEAHQVFQPGSAAGWEGKLTGRILHIELDDLISGRFPHKLSGLADLSIEEARFGNGRLEKAKGLLTAGPGVVSRSLLEASMQYLELVPGVDLGPLAEQVRYQQLAAAISLDETGLRVEGRCTSNEPGTLLVDEQRSVLRNPKAQPQPAAGLAAALAPADAYRVPLAGPAQDLSQRLPLPTPQKSSTADRRPPRAHLRLHE